MTLPFLFKSVTAATGQDLDNDFAAVGQMGVLPCTVTGTNALVLTPGANTPTILAYSNYQRFSGVAANTNSAATTARVGALSILPVYIDTGAGPAALGGGEIVQNNLIEWVYDSALNSGSGGFHLTSSVPITELLDTISAVQGAMLYRGASAWGALSPGTSLQALATAGASQNPFWASISTLLDLLATTRGDIIYRGASAWSALAPGTSLQILATAGSSQNPFWASISPLLDAISSTRGTILYRGASGWAALGVGTSGFTLHTAGAAQDPYWA